MTTTVCRHCGLPLGGDAEDGFCCGGCRGAYALINDLGLGTYYRRRVLDAEGRPMRPDDEGDFRADFRMHARDLSTGLSECHLMVEGLQCAACVWLIEAILARNSAVVWGRVNMTTRRLLVRWKTVEGDINQILAPVLAVGYRLVPYDPAKMVSDTEKVEKDLLRAMAVAGFAASNVMLFSISIWAGSDMGPATRAFMHWLSALVAMPAIVYCIRPFARSAIQALSHGRTNMDVPITVGVSLTAGMSLYETMTWGHHAYFDSAISLLFFLLIGRYLDSRARGQARAAVQHLLALENILVTVVGEDGARCLVKPDSLRAGQLLAVAAGERIGADGVVIEGRSDVDTSLLTGETVPVALVPGDKVFAGTVNLSAPMRVQVEAMGGETLLAEIVRLMEVAEQGRAKYVMLADRVARYYAPVVHLSAFLTFLVWHFGLGLDWQNALLNAVSVLIITCPCALALAVPVVQVIASGRLLSSGIILKSATALERLAEVDTVVFDKTGTLTLGKPVLVADSGYGDDDLVVAVGMAAASRHPLARALASCRPDVPMRTGVTEIPGSGLVAGELRLGNRRHVGLEPSDEEQGDIGPELWLARPGQDPVRFGFQDQARRDAAQVVHDLARMGIAVELLSGDLTHTVSAIAADTGIDTWTAVAKPAAKVAHLAALAAKGRKVLMVGDGLNDAPALASAHVSMSPSTAVDVTRTAADVVFQGALLGPVVETIKVARRARFLVAENFGVALLYNVITVPAAVVGLVTPLIAAIAMSTSSLIVIVNALRLVRRRTT